MGLEKRARTALWALCSAALGCAALGCAGTLERGEALYRQGDLRGALDTWGNITPKERGYESTQGRVVAVRSELQRSFRLYQKRGRYYEDAGRTAEALLYYRLALKLDPSQRELMDRVQLQVRELAERKRRAREALAQALAQGQLLVARQHADTLVSLDPFDPAVQLEVRQVRSAVGAELTRHVESGKALYSSGAYPAAEGEFRTVLALDADNEEALGYLHYIRALQNPGVDIESALADAGLGGGERSRPVLGGERAARSASEAAPDPSPAADVRAARSETAAALQGSPASGAPGEPGGPTPPVTQEDILAAGHYRSATQAEQAGDAYWAIQQYEATLRVRPRHAGAQQRLAALRQRLLPQVEALDEAGKRFFREEDVQNALVMWSRVLLIDPTRERTSRNVEDARKILSRLEEIQASDD